MEIRLDRLGDEPFTWQEDFELTSEELSHPDIAGLGKVRCTGKIKRSTSGYFLRASLSYDQTVRCIRCLRPTAQAIEASLDLLVQVSSELADSEIERELEQDDLGLLSLTEPLLRTRPLVCEQVQLNVPMKAVCGADCRGLCGSCGADLNQGGCDCETEADPRWAALQDLKKQLEGGS